MVSDEELERLDDKLQHQFNGQFRINAEDDENLIYYGEFFENTGDDLVLHFDPLVLLDLSVEENLQKVKEHILNEEYGYFQHNFLDKVVEFCKKKEKEYSDENNRGNKG